MENRPEKAAAPEDTVTAADQWFVVLLDGLAHSTRHLQIEWERLDKPFCPGYPEGWPSFDEVAAQVDRWAQTVKGVR